MELTPHIRKATAFRWPLFAALCLIPILGGCGGAPLNLTTLAEQVILGLILGSVYALIALGYTLVYGVIKLINFAHGDIYMLGAFTGYYMLRITIRWLHFEHGVSLVFCFIISTVVSAAICALLAVLMERLAYRPLRGSSRIAALITAVGVSFLLENSGIIVFGPNPKSYEPKTLEVFQLQIADNAQFSNAKPYEIFEAPQKTFPLNKFKEPAYARVRIVTKAGTSEWGPSLLIDPAIASGYLEFTAGEIAAFKAAGEQVSRLPSIGYRVADENGGSKLQLTWANGNPSEIQLNSVFSDSAGKQMVFHLGGKLVEQPPQVDAATGKEFQPPPKQDGGLRIPVFYVVIVGVTVILLWLLNILINKSTFGICMRALSFDMDAARLMGVNTDRIIAQTFAIGGACAAVAGNMVGIYNQSIEPLMGILPGLKAFVAAVVGGIGSIPGAAAGGMIMGLSEALVKGWIDPAWSALADAVAFAILILVLLFKPTGIFGRTVKEKV